jgi:hypothetical protein
MFATVLFLGAAVFFLTETGNAMAQNLYQLDPWYCGVPCNESWHDCYAQCYDDCFSWCEQQSVTCHTAWWDCIFDTCVCGYEPGR